MVASKNWIPSLVSTSPQAWNKRLNNDSVYAICYDELNNVDLVRRIFKNISSNNTAV